MDAYVNRYLLPARHQGSGDSDCDDAEAPDVAASLPEVDERGLTAEQRLQRLQKDRKVAEMEKKKAYTAYRSQPFEPSPVNRGVWVTSARECAGASAECHHRA